MQSNECDGWNRVSVINRSCYYVPVCGRQNNGATKVSTSESPEPVNMLPNMAKGTLQI